MTSFSFAVRRNSRRGVGISLAAVAALMCTTSLTRADDLTIPNGTTITDPIFTSTAENGTPGSVIVEVGASVTLGAAATDPAITIDSGAASVTNAGTIKAVAADQVGISAAVATTGGIKNTGTITTGTAEVKDATGAVTTAAIGGGPAIHVEADLGTGIDNTGTITTTASATNPFAVLIETNGAPVTIGNVDDATPALAYSLHNSGSILANGYDATAAAVALGLRGQDAVNSVTLSGIHNEKGVIRATSVDADATAIDIGQFVTLGDGATTGLVNTGTISAAVAAATTASTATAVRIGADATVNTIDNSGAIQATTSGTVGGDAYAIDIDAAGTLDEIKNTGTILATSSSDGTTATAIRDLSGMLTTIDNGEKGIITTATTATGRAIALDLNSATANTTVKNAGTIKGDILLGDGNYTFEATGGAIAGNIEVDGATSIFNLSGTAVLKASSILTNAGTLDLNAGSGATFQAGAGDFDATTAVFNSGAIFSATYDAVAGTQGGILKAGAATFHDGAIVDIELTSYLGSGTAVITLAETTGSLTLDTPGDTSGLVIGGIGAGYNAAVDLANAGADLVVTLSRKTAAQLGLSRNVAAIYDAAPTALVADTAFGVAVGNLATEDEVRAAYAQLLPDLSGAREQQAIRVQDVTAGIVSDRLDLLRTSEQSVGYGGNLRSKKFRGAGFWAQQGVSSEKGKGGTDSLSYSGNLYTLALGYDSRDRDGDVWGGALTYSAMNYSTGRATEDNLSQSTMIQVYRSMNRGPLFWDTFGALGWNSYEAYRNVTVAAISRNTSASWSGYQAGLSSQVGYSAVWGPIAVRPSVGASYTFLQQEAFKESGGGMGVDLEIDSNSFQSLRANAELRVTGIFGGDTKIAPFVRGGISHELLEARGEAQGKFVAGGPSFSLQGETLDKDVPFVGAGVSVVGGYSRLSLEYTGQLGSKFTSHQAAATFSLMF
ncbi:MAG: autotransporter domain-containing protein [Parvibaculum sp.]|uniref:autotransporter outer membrane beta-barrel domain-containing protein n=1 Tax=Parvibaculum sp. TaxID=2024848 RepID=UPI003C72F9B8